MLASHIERSDRGGGALSKKEESSHTAALPQHTAVRLCLTGKLYRFLEAQPRNLKPDSRKGIAFPPCAAAKPLCKFTYARESFALTPKAEPVLAEQFQSGLSHEFYPSA